MHVDTGPVSVAVPKGRLIVPPFSMGVVHYGEAKSVVTKALGPGKRIARDDYAYLGGRIRVVYSFHDRYTGKAQAMITRWPGFRTRSGVHVGSPRQALRVLHVKCFDRYCSSGKNPDFPGIIFTMRHGRVVEIYVGAS